MKRTRRCDDRCHNAVRVRCKCWCGGFFHGQGVEAEGNRAKVEEAVQFLEEHGTKAGKTAYISQKKMAL